MNGFNFSEASDIKLGGSTITALYFGSTKLWPTSHDYSLDYFTIESLENSNAISLSKSSSTSSDKTIQWSTDGTTWNTYTSSYPSTTITTLNTGDKIMIKGSNTSYQGNKITSTKKFNVYGNIMSLLYGDNFVGQTTLTANNTFNNFLSKSNLVDASNLILAATTLSANCYRQMFFLCALLTTAPELPATTLVDYCYYGMFQSCRILTTAPLLSATTLRKYCYGNMFSACSQLNSITCLATNITAANSMLGWLSSVSATGTFTKKSGVTYPSGQNGIPSGWAVVDVS